MSARSLSLQPIPVLLKGRASEGRLALADGQLVAVLVLLDGDVDAVELKGSWFLEAGIGPCATITPPLFPDLSEAEHWIRKRLPEPEPA